MARIAVAMSGGVDSSVAAALLHEQGHEVVGVTLQLWDYTDHNLAAGGGRCCSPADILDARRVAGRVGFPHYVFDHGAEFRRTVVDPFLDSWSVGRTPSPCIGCNRHIKFDALWDLARSLGAERLATGHYARLEKGAPYPRLRKGRDRDKDQSYFLFDIHRERLEGVLFPVGGLTKAEVRDAARRLAIGVADKPESHELCFIPDGDKDAFVERRRGSARGPIRDADGEVLGEHEGTHRFTIGQRRGLGIGGSERRYVIDIDGDSGAVTVGSEGDLLADELVAERCNWLAMAAPESPLRVAARIRHRHREAAATVTPGDDGSARVVFDEPQRAVAPGQGVAFYEDDLLLGGGWIASARRLSFPARLPA